MPKYQYPLSVDCYVLHASPQGQVAGDVTEEIGDAEPAPRFRRETQIARLYWRIRARRNQLTSRGGALKIERQ
jgi:hypothetical protein